MRNLCKICVLCAFLGVAVNAKEINGVFVGFEAGAGEQSIVLSSGRTENTVKNTAAVFGVKLGYKHFFLDWVGIRGYASVDYTESRYHTAEKTATETATRKSWRTGVLGNAIYSANIDALFNFYNSENVAAGAFVGLGIGGQTAFDSYYIYTDEVRTITDLYSDVKVGLRVNFANHGVDFIAKIPLNNATKTFREAIGDIKAKYRQTYQVMLGYNFTF